MNVFIAVTHLLGTGHLSRALTIARAFSAAGHKVTVASGGMPVPQFERSGIQFVQLPPLRSDGVNFTRLLTVDGEPADTGYLAKRSAALARCVTECAPSVLITELFPFGRRVLRDEFIALISAAHELAKPPVVLASVRDILSPPSKPDRANAAGEIFRQYFDGVLVHSDPRSTPLEQSWPVSDAIQEKLYYTGYVAPVATGAHPQATGAGEILVSAGGGEVGDALFETAIDAARLSSDTVWRLLIGGSQAETRIERLVGKSDRASVLIEPPRPDFRQMLYHAACSVSMCGYNTALDLLQAGTPSVLVPFDDGGETEQTLRARSLVHLGGFELIKTADLTARSLLDAVQSVQERKRTPGAGLGFDGAEKTVEITERLVEGHT